MNTSTKPTVAARAAALIAKLEAINEAANAARREHFTFISSKVEGSEMFTIDRTMGQGTTEHHREYDRNTGIHFVCTGLMRKIGSRPTHRLLDEVEAIAAERLGLRLN